MKIARERKTKWRARGGEITPAQARVLKVLEKLTERENFPPTRAELAKECGFASPNAAQEHLEALARKGAIVMYKNLSRGIQIK
jgi:repressor LexA